MINATQTHSDRSVSYLMPRADSVPLDLLPTDILKADGTRLDPDEHKLHLRQLLFKLAGYYALLGAACAAILMVMPWLGDHLPVGGLNAFDGMGSEINELERVIGRGGAGVLEPGGTLSPGSGQGWLGEATQLSIAMLSTFLLMLPVSWVYKRIHEGDEYDHSIDETVLILPAIFAGIITVVQHSLTLAFALAGIMAGVRFRRALQDTSDTLFLFVAIGVGIAAGASSIEIALVLTVFFNFLMVGVCISGDGLESKYRAQKRSAKMVEKCRRQAEAAELALHTEAG